MDELPFPCDRAILGDVRATVRQFAASHGLGPEATGDLVLAVDEACDNVIAHAFPDPPPPGATFTIELVRTGPELEVVVRHRGAPFEPSQAPDTTFEQWIDRGTAGGLGLALIRRLVDGLSYGRSADGTNMVRIVKTLPPEKAT